MHRREKRIGVEIPELPKPSSNVEPTQSQTPSSTTLSTETKETSFPPRTEERIVEDVFFDFTERASEKPEEIGEEIREFVGIFDDEDFRDIVYMVNSTLNDLAKKKYYSEDSKKCLIMGKLTRKMLIYYSFKIKLIHIFAGAVFIMYVLPTIKLVWDWIVSLKERKEKEEGKDVAHIDGRKEETNPGSA